MAAMEGDGDGPGGQERFKADELPLSPGKLNGGMGSPGLGAASPALLALSRSTIRSTASYGSEGRSGQTVLSPAAAGAARSVVRRVAGGAW